MLIGVTRASADHTPAAGHARLRELAALTASATGANAASRWLLRKRLAILMFHGVEPDPLQPACWHVLDTQTFRAQLEFVRDHFEVLPLDEALERMQAGTLPDRAAALTFDDGTRNLATEVAPVLHELGLPASFFLATGAMESGACLWPDRLWLAFARTEAHAVDLTPLGMGTHQLPLGSARARVCAAVTERLKELSDEQRIAHVESLISSLNVVIDDPGPFRMLSWDDVDELATDELVTLNPHTVTHPILSRCADEKVEHEITQSCTALAQRIGRDATVFAYPNGRAQDFDERARQAVTQSGVRWALATTYGLADENSDPLALPRIPVGSNLSLAEFKTVVSGVPLWLRAGR